MLTLVVLLALLGGAVVGVYLASPWLAAKYLPPYAASFGIEITRLEIGRPIWTGVTIERLEAETRDVSVMLHDGVIRFQWRELFDGNLRSLEIARLQLIAAQRDTQSQTSAPTAVSFDPASLFSLVPFAQVSVAELITELPALNFRSTGSLAVHDGVLNLESTGLAPAAAQDLRVSGRLSSQGLIELDLSTTGSTGEAFLSVSSTIQDSALAVDAQVDADGFPFALLSTAAGMPAGEGRMVGQVQTTLPWPVAPQDLLDAEIDGEFELDWQSADGTITVSELVGSLQRRGAVIQATFSAGAMEYDDHENVVTTNIDAPVRADWNGSALQVADGISYRLKAADVTVSGEVVRMTFAPEHERPIGAELRAAIQIDDLLHSGAMSLAGRLTESRFSADGVWTTAGWSLPFQIEHNLQRGRGELTSAAEINLHKPLAASLLSPWRELYDLDDGTLRYSATATWSEASTLNMELILDDVRATYDDYLLTGVDAELIIAWQDDSLTLQPAEVTARLFDPGVPFTGMTTTVALRDGLLNARDTRFEMLGGQVAVGEFVYDLDSEQTQQPVLVELQGIALDQVLALEGDSISGQGLISGQLPIEIRKGLPSIPSGEVMALDPGGLLQLSDDFASVSGQPGLDFALTALTDYRFTSLVAGVEYSEDGELKLAIQLQGSNPEVENGRPIHYNLNITENVLVLLRSLRAQRAVTDGLERRVFN